MSQNWGSKHVGLCYTFNVNKVYICQIINISTIYLSWKLSKECKIFKILTVVTMKITVFWDVFFYLEVGGSTVFQNSDAFLPYHSVTYQTMVIFVPHIRTDFVTKQKLCMINQTKLKHSRTLVLCEELTEVYGHVLCHVSKLLTPLAQIFACDLNFWKILC
jgi:hypothetical protein